MTIEIRSFIIYLVFVEMLIYLEKAARLSLHIKDGLLGCMKHHTTGREKRHPEHD